MTVSFAGHYSVLEWGDNDRLSMAVIDARTGEVFEPPFAKEPNSFSLPRGLSLKDPPECRIRSRLMIFRNVCTGYELGCGTYFFTWRLNRWTQIYWEPPPRPAPDEPPQRIRFAALVSKIEPVYPVVAKEKAIEGAVWLDAAIEKDGHVKSVQPISGSPVLAYAAKDAVMQWVYIPTLLNNEPTDVMVRGCVPFVLRQSKQARSPCSPSAGRVR